MCFLAWACGQDAGATWALAELMLSTSLPKGLGCFCVLSVEVSLPPALPEPSLDVTREFGINLLALIIK